MTRQPFAIVVSTGELTANEQSRVFCAALEFLSSRVDEVRVSSWSFGDHLGEPIPEALVTPRGAVALFYDATERGVIDEFCTDIWVECDAVRLHFCNDGDIHFETDERSFADELEALLRGLGMITYRHDRG